MFNWFKKKEAEKTVFETSEKAFAHACALGYHPLMGALIPALVLEEGGLNKNGERTFLINLALTGGGRVFWCCALKESEGYPKAGELAGFRIVTIASDLPEEASLIGYLACRLDPVFVQGKGWLTSEIFTPDNIKPAFRPL